MILTGALTFAALFNRIRMADGRLVLLQPG
jgi:hypothetical protein